MKRSPDIGFVIPLYLPGYNTDIIGPILWIIGAVFSTISIRSTPRKP